MTTWFDRFNLLMADCLGRLLPNGAYNKLVYSMVPRILSPGGFRGRFFNQGYAGTSTLMLNPEDETERLFFQLYHHVTQTVDMCNRVVLEVGCGRGGGCYYASRYRRAARIIGLDFSPTHVQLCSRLALANAEFHQGVAERLPFADASVDVIMNVESSHAYASVPQFLCEAFRVLKPGGQLAFCDIRKAGVVDLLEEQFSQSGFRIEYAEDITPAVLAAIEQLDDYKAGLVKQAGIFGRLITREFLITTDSDCYRGLRGGEIVYRYYLLRKKAN